MKTILVPLDEVISKEFCLDFFRCPVKLVLQELLALPPTLGGMRTINPIKAEVDEFKGSACLTKLLTKKIVEQDRNGSINKDEVTDV